MFQRIRNRPRDERGFTLVELMVVVLIIGLLLAIGIPTFLGARTRAQDSAAKSNLRTSLTAAGVIYTDNETFTAADATALTTAEGSLNFVPAATASTKNDMVSVDPKANWGAAAKSQSGNCFYVLSTSAGKVTYGSSKAGKCTGDEAATYATGAKW